MNNKIWLFKAIIINYAQSKKVSEKFDLSVVASQTTSRLIFLAVKLSLSLHISTEQSVKTGQ